MPRGIPNPKNAVAKAATAAAVAAAGTLVHAAAPLPMVNMPQPQMQLDLTIRTDDVVDIMVSEQREALSMQAEAVEQDLQAAYKAHGKAERGLTQLAEKLIDEQTADTATKTLVERMDEFSGTKHGIKIVKVDAPESRYHTNKEDDDAPEVNIQKLKIVGEIRIVRKDHDVVLKRRFELPFTEAMKSAVSDIEGKADAARKIEESLRDIKKKMADAVNPNGLRMRTKSQLVKAYLQGQIGNTGDMLQTVMSTPVKALPSHISNAKTTVVGGED